MNKQKPYIATLDWLFFTLVVLALAGCGGADPAANVAAPPVRQARPTFTPTVAVQQEAQTTSEEQPPANNPAPNQTSNEATVAAANPTPPTAAPTNANKAIVVITEELVNARTGPGLNYSLVDTVKRGEQFDIVGKTVDGGWWQVCCVKQQPVWVINQFVDTDGDLNNVTVINDLPAVDGVQPVAQATAAPAVAVNQPAATPVPAATQAPAPPQPPAFAFDLTVQEQFPDTNVVHIFLYVFQGTEALPGYQLRVVHNAAELTTSSEVSIGPLPALTWPFSDGRQRLQNLKVEFSGEPPGGTWDVQLIQNGQPVGPVATFKLSDNEPNRELYVRYQKK